MTITKTDIVGKIRTAIDDIAPETSDSFTTDTDTELWQAVQHAVTSLLISLPLIMLEPKAMNATATSNTDGSGYVTLPDDFLRFVVLQLRSWAGPVFDLMEPGSDEAKRQRSLWGRGTPEKPKAMIDHGSGGKKILKYWSAGKSGGSYDHSISVLNYIPRASVVNDTITCALKEAAESALINLAASIFFEGKKEAGTAEKFRALQ